MKVDATPDEVEAILRLYKNNTKIDTDSGTLQFGNLPVLWARADVFTNMFLELENLVGASASSVMKRIGEQYGKKFYNLLKSGNTSLLINDTKKVYNYLCAETQAIGWGQIEIEEVEDEIILTSLGFAAARSYIIDNKKRETPVDSYFLGYFEGFFTEMHQKKYIGEEVECLAMGHDNCKMVFKIE